MTKRITATVTEEIAGALMSLLLDHRVLDLHMETIQNDGPSPKKSFVKRVIEGRTVAGSIMETLTAAGKPLNIAAVRKAMKKYGYAPNSATSAMSLLIKNGYVEDTDYGYKKLKDAPVDLVFTPGK